MMVRPSQLVTMRILPLVLFFLAILSTDATSTGKHKY